ncbi:MAG TPA: hypothetical protein VMZ66_12875 [Aeromicrobium sp.]|nr:hypothetical protein [Aeromicrobium sp.]
METPRDPITVRWWLLLTMVICITAGLAIGWAISTKSLSDAQAKVQAAVTDASRAESAEAKALQCADFADDKTREEFIRYGGPAKGCDMGYASRDRSRELVSRAHVKADKADVNAEIVQRNVTAASGVVDLWLFGIALAVTMGAATLAIAPRRSRNLHENVEGGSATEPDTLGHAQ